MLKITENVYVDPNDVSSVEREICRQFISTRPSGGHYKETFNGSRIILKNGQKVYADKIMPDEVLRILEIEIANDDQRDHEAWLKYTGRK